MEVPAQLKDSPASVRARAFMAKARSTTGGIIAKSQVMRDATERDKEPALKYIVKGTIKGFLVYVLPVSLLRRKPAGFARGAAVGIFVGVVRAFHRLLKRINAAPDDHPVWGPVKRLNLPLYAIAGGLSSLIGMWLDPTIVNSTFVFWCIVRALRCFPWPHIPHAPTLFMCLAAAQIGADWACTPEHLAPGYLRFLNKQGELTPTQLKNIIITQDFCNSIHGGDTCFKHNGAYVIREFFRATKIYFPLYLAFALMTQRIGFKTLQRLVDNVARSSAFLAVYCLFGHLGGCLFYRIWKGEITRWTLYAHTWTSGLATLIERPNRRVELAAYCCTFALDSVYRYFRVNGRLKQRKWLGVLGIMLSMAAMMHYHDQQPRVVVKWLFGVV